MSAAELPPPPSRHTLASPSPLAACLATHAASPRPPRVAAAAAAAPPVAATDAAEAAFVARFFAADWACAAPQRGEALAQLRNAPAERAPLADAAAALARERKHATEAAATEHEDASASLSPTSFVTASPQLGPLLLGQPPQQQQQQQQSAPQVVWVVTPAPQPAAASAASSPAPLFVLASPAWSSWQPAMRPAARLSLPLPLSPPQLQQQLAPLQLTPQLLSAQSPPPQQGADDTSGALKPRVVTASAVRFACPWPGCRSTFTVRSNCLRHLRSHTGHRPFACDVCGKRYQRNWDLKRHRWAVHSGAPLTASEAADVAAADGPVALPPLLPLSAASSSSTVDSASTLTPPPL
jgi:hypothetical protein